METEGLLKPFIWHCPAPYEFSPILKSYYFKIQCNVILSPMYEISRWSLPLVFSIKIFYHFESLNSVLIMSDFIVWVKSVNYEAILFLAVPMNMHSHVPNKTSQYLSDTSYWWPLIIAKLPATDILPSNDYEELVLQLAHMMAYTNMFQQFGTSSLLQY
jgi:hypothetical protein